jgi:hypothetical protein
MKSLGYIIQVTFIDGKRGFIESTKDLGAVARRDTKAARFPSLESAKRAAGVVRSHFRGASAEVVELYI